MDIKLGSKRSEKFSKAKNRGSSWWAISHGKPESRICMKHMINVHTIQRHEGKEQMALILKKCQQGTSLVVPWLRLHASDARDTCSIPDQGTKIPHAAKCGPLSPQKRFKERLKDTTVRRALDPQPQMATESSLLCDFLSPNRCLLRVYCIPAAWRLSSNC